ncbi:MAG: single-stranded-DNA-specific exonuclease RecJ [Chloroflexi bacterium]|nr:single-stranded-DNA-specific exonuclease RecJ [Chloroflexota bacterium]
MNWIEPQENPICDELLAAAGGSPLVARALARRGLTRAEQAAAYLDPRAYASTPPEALPGMKAAVERLERAIRGGESICVWGDFDVDGQTSTALLTAALRSLGAQATYHIPVRAYESHGVNLPNLARLLDQGAQVVLTCDTGVNAFEAAEYARSRGVDFIVSDHHDLPEEPLGLPAALAVVNPKRLPPGHPLRPLPGVGVAYKVAEALLRRAGREQECAAYHDLAALGIVADLAALTGEARYLAQLGLEALRRAPRPALGVMLELAEFEPGGLNEEHIGYVLAPRLNALGRLDDANPAVEFLLAADRDQARPLAYHLEALNARRRLLTRQTLQGAQAQLEQNPAWLEAPAIVLAHADWPSGVIGIVAGQLAARYHKPALLLSAPPGETARGSARSIPGVDINAAISACRHLLLGFGGHPMAAGLAIPTERIPDLRRALGRAVRSQQPAQPAPPDLQLDAYLPQADLTLDEVSDQERLAPFGVDNPPLALACRNLRIVESKPMGREEEHLRLTLEDELGGQFSVVWWQVGAASLPGGRFDLAYTARASAFGGQRRVQIEWLDARPVVSAAVEAAAPRIRQITDRRGQLQPLPALQRLLAAEPGFVWREGEARERLPGLGRAELAPARLLVIWTTPPGPQELQAALQAVQPQHVAIFGIDPEAVRLESFLSRLAGLCKRALSAAGQVSLAALSTALAARPEAVRSGLAWLQASGHIRFVEDEQGEIRLSAGGETDPAQKAAASARLQAILDETAAYRAYFARASAENLFLGL